MSAVCHLVGELQAPMLASYTSLCSHVVVVVHNREMSIIVDA